MELHQHSINALAYNCARTAEFFGHICVVADAELSSSFIHHHCTDTSSIRGPIQLQCSGCCEHLIFDAVHYVVIGLRRM